MNSPTLPVVKPLIVCEKVTQVPGSGNLHFENIFSAIRSRDWPPFPYRKDQFCVFVQLSDASGNLPAWVQVVDADTFDPVFRTADHPLTFPHRRWVLRARFQIRQCLFPHPGEYLIQFFCAGEMMADHVLYLLGPEE
jgi:hypothetical protein